MTGVDEGGVVGGVGGGVVGGVVRGVARGVARGVVVRQGPTNILIEPQSEWSIARVEEKS